MLCTSNDNQNNMNRLYVSLKSKDNVNKQDIELLFGHPKVCFGNTVKEIILSNDKKSATIVYDKSEGIKKLITESIKNDFAEKLNDYLIREINNDVEHEFVKNITAFEETFNFKKDDYYKKTFSNSDDISSSELNDINTTSSITENQSSNDDSEENLLVNIGFDSKISSKKKKIKTGRKTNEFNNRDVLISNAIDIQEELLYSYFTTKKLTSGGEIELLQKCDEFGCYLVCYKTQEVTDRVIKRKRINVEDFQFDVSRPVPEDLDRIIFVKEMTNENKRAFHIRISNEAGETSDDEEELDVINIDEEGGIIRMKNVHAAKRLLKKKKIDLLNITINLSELPTKLYKTVRDSQINDTYEKEVIYTKAEENLDSSVDNDFFSVNNEKCSVEQIVHCSEKSFKTENENIISNNFDKSKESDVTSNRIKENSVECSQNEIDYSIVEIRGNFSDINKDTLKLFFTNASRSGGGPMKDEILFDNSMERAFLSYMDPNVAKSVYDGKEFKVCERIITVSENNNVIDVTEFETSSAIEVTGADLDRQSIQDYFSNRVISGGGEIKDIFMDDCNLENNFRIVVIFKDNKAPKRVIQKLPPIKIQSKTVKITVLKPYKEKPVEGKCCTNKIVVNNIPINVSEETLELKLEDWAGVPILSKCYAVDPTIAFFEFKRKPNLKEMIEECQQIPFYGQMLGIQRIGEINTILVTNIGSLDEESLKLYFENKKSGGKADCILNLTIDESSEKYCVIDIKDHETVENILRIKNHTLSKTNLVVMQYNPYIGYIPPEHDISKRGVKMPEEFEFKISSVMLKYLTNNHWDKFKSDLQSNFCSFVGQNNSILLSPNIPRKTKNIYELARNWQHIIKVHIKEFLSIFNEREFSILEDIRSEVIKNLNDTFNSKSNKYLIYEDHKRKVICIAGKKPFVDEVIKTIEDSISFVEMEMIRLKQIVTENLDLKSTQLKYLLNEKFLKQIENEFGETLKVDVTHKGITLTGMPDDIIKIKTKVLETVLNLTDNSYSVSQYFQDSIDNNPIFFQTLKSKIDEMLKSNDIVATYEIKKNELKVFGASDTVVDKALNQIQNFVIDGSHPLTEDNLNVFENKDKWNEFVIMMKEQYDCLQLDYDNSNVKFITIFNYSDGLMEDITNFLKENTMISDKINIGNKNVCIYLKKYQQRKFSSIVNRLKSYKLTYTIDERTAVLKFNCTCFGIEAFKIEINKVLQSLIIGRHISIEPGIQKFFASRAGTMLLENISDKNESVIAVDTGENAEISNDILQNESSIKKLFSGKLKSGQWIITGIGDIGSCNTEAAVNAANKSLAHMGGIARYFVQKGGDIIQHESSEYIKKHGDINISEVVVTGAGRLNFKNILHAVGPIWYGGNKDERNQLYATIHNCLKMCDKHKLKTISIPAISTGVFNFPLVEATEIILEAIKDYFEKTFNSQITQVILIDNGTKVSDAFTNAAKQLFSDNSLKIEERLINNERQIIIDDRPLSNEKNIKDYEKIFKSSSKPNNFFTTAFGVKVHCKTDNLCDQNVDVIVNSVSTNLNLNDGFVSKSILKKAGIQLQQECSNNYPNGIRPGEIAITSGGNLNCKHIFHVNCINYNESTSETFLKNLINNCLVNCISQGHSSIAFPVIGTGRLKHPYGVTAKIMMDCIKNFNPTAQGGATSPVMMTVFFIIYKNDDINAFLQHIPNNVTASSTNAVVHKEGRHDDNAKETFNFKRENDFLQVQFGHIVVQIDHGDLLKEKKVDAIINSSNRDLDFNKGYVSRLLWEAGGKIFQDDCVKKESKEKMAKTGICITYGGDLFVKKVIHIDMQRFSLGQAINKCIEYADKKAINTLSMPALGTGTLLLNSPIKPIEETLKALKYSSEKNLKHLKLVRIVVFQKDMLDIYLNVTERLLQSPKSSWFSNFFTGVKNMYSNMFNPSFNINGDGGKEIVEQTELRNIEIKQNNSVNLIIITKDDETLKFIKQEVDDHIKEEIQERYINKPIISRLNAEDGQRIIEYAKTKDAIVKIDSESGKIIIRSHHKVVMDVYDHISALLEKAMENEQENRHATEVSQRVSWMYEESLDNWKKYPIPLSAKIEEAYQRNNNDSLTYKDSHKKSFVIDFSKMTEYPETDVKDVIKIKRKDLMIKDSFNAFKFPDTWVPMGANENCKRVIMDSNSAEYIKISNLVMATCRNTISCIYQIERIQNQALYKQYLVKKQLMDSSNLPNMQNERQLFHGTAFNTLDSINHNGFDRSYCGKNATVYGRGVYFAADSHYSAQNTYAPPSGPNNYKHLYVANVLVGQSCKGSQNMPALPPINPAIPNKLYDSSVDNVSNPRVFVTFRDDSAYPEYLVSFS